MELVVEKRIAALGFPQAALHHSWRRFVADLFLETCFRVIPRPICRLGLLPATRAEQKPESDTNCGYGPVGLVPPPVVPVPSVVPLPLEHIWTRNMVSVRVCRCTISSARRITPNLGMQMIDP